jgi:transcriptional regulator with XRE-family HTH domain
MPKKATRISEQLRAALANAGESRYRIAQATGISQAVLSRFVRGECGLSLDYIDVLGEHLGLELRSAAKRTKRTKKGR